MKNIQEFQFESVKNPDSNLQFVYARFYDLGLNTQILQLFTYAQFQENGHENVLQRIFHNQHNHRLEQKKEILEY